MDFRLTTGSAAGRDPECVVSLHPSAVTLEDTGVFSAADAGLTAAPHLPQNFFEREISAPQPLQEVVTGALSDEEAGPTAAPQLPQNFVVPDIPAPQLLQDMVTGISIIGTFSSGMLFS
jgi:hypothetical protein